jgi:DNA primase
MSLSQRKQSIKSIYPPRHLSPILESDLEEDEQNFLALCSFHEDEVGSMLFYPDPNSNWKFKCLHCGMQGDLLKFAQKSQRWSWEETLSWFEKQIAKD